MIGKGILLAMFMFLGACAAPVEGGNTNNISKVVFPHSKEKIPIVELKNAPSDQYDAFLNGTLADKNDGLKGLLYAGTDKLLHPDDIIEITILDTGEDGLFASANSKVLNIGRFTVDHNGFVTLPFIGKIKVTNLTYEGLQKRIVKGLMGSTINPQAVVTVVDKPSNAVTMNGAVRNPGRFAFTSAHMRILDVLALAGGATAKSADITLIREKNRVSVSLDRVMKEDEQNVYLQAGDQLLLEAHAVKFTAIGAFKNPGEFEFEHGQLTLAQAVAQAGGLLEDRSYRRNLYVLRSISTANSLVPANSSSADKAMIYHVDMREVSNLILMQQFYMREGDMLFAKNTSFLKFLSQSFSL